MRPSRRGGHPVGSFGAIACHMLAPNSRARVNCAGRLWVHLPRCHFGTFEFEPQPYIYIYIYIYGYDWVWVKIRPTDNCRF